jgi:hypothetical protein
MGALGDVVSLAMVEGKMLLNLKNDTGYLVFGQQCPRRTASA